MKNTFGFGRSIVLCVFLSGASGCGSNATLPGQAPVIARIEIIKPTPNFAGMTVGVAVQLKAQGYTAAGAPMTVPPLFIWSSTDSTVLAVDQSGLVTAKNNGRATILVSMQDNGRTVGASVDLEVIVLV